MLTLADYPIVFEQRVAWGDMDAFGHVNNVIYYRYIESARLYYLEPFKNFTARCFDCDCLKSVQIYTSRGLS